MSFGCYYVEYVCWITISGRKREMIRKLLTTDNIWQSAYGLIWWNSLSPHMYTVHRQIKREVNSPKKRLWIRHPDRGTCNYKVAAFVWHSHSWFCPPHPDLCRTFWQKVCGIYCSSPSFRIKVINLYLLLSWVWWLWLFHWNVKKRQRRRACVRVDVPACMHV